MKVFYLVVTLKKWEGGQLMPANIAGRYNSMEELQADEKRAVDYWLACHKDEARPEHGLRPIYIYSCSAKI